ncbi:phBC6A51 family helix-turn-helix protein [Acetivibrio cellulolyticus]|uniref:phBC6A51 family helix-turn-helix protein n=1 Tax=Acetivibrio cellulolyticus TaxID=35830 RepID=UPI0001E2BDC2|nr:phBC6A51 family helix-turn-helix protein [Acetivibrio cellulolyticus]
MLDERQLKAIALLIENNRKKTEIAEIVGVSRQCIYDWMKNTEFSTELDSRLQEIKTYGENNIKANLYKYIQTVDVLASTAESEKIRLDAAQYLIDRVLGKTTSKLDITAEAKQSISGSDILEDFEEDEEEQ